MPTLRWREQSAYPRTEVENSIRIGHRRSRRRNILRQFQRPARAGLLVGGGYFAARNSELENIPFRWKSRVGPGAIGALREQFLPLRDLKVAIDPQVLIV